MTDHRPRPVDVFHDECMARAEAERPAAPATDRATVLREAAEVAARLARGCGDSEAGQYAASVAAGIGKELRRMADEAQQGPARPRCPHCQLTHDLTPSMQLTCASIRASISDQPAVEAQQPSLGVEDCTCIPFTRQGGVQRYCQPGDTVDMISGWEIGGDCPHHRDAVNAQQPKEA